ncbi:hypothetical protein NIES4101_71860 [Calothrix sp. NIES-4101]|nr:hypothetical protein NIES4101_71860 [Calothrix sp. NIES-4101]
MGFEGNYEKGIVIYSEELKTLKLKKHGRRNKSIFRYDFDYLRSICSQFWL